MAAPRAKRYEDDATEQALAALDPDQEAALLAATEEKFARVSALAGELGLKPEVIGRMIARMRARYQPIAGELQKHKTSEILEMIEDRIGRALGYLDDFVLSKATAKDLAITLGILLEKRQLLRGEPTQILSVEERQGLNELLPKLIAEAQRRGLSIDVTTGSAMVLPPSVERATRPRQGWKSAPTFQAMKQKAGAEEIGEPH